MKNAVPVETPPGVHLGMRLRQARLALGLTQAEVAAALRPPITAQAVSKFELGLATPTNRTLIELARVLKTTPAWLLSAPPVDIRWIAFRKHSALSARDQERLKAFAQPRVEGEVKLRSLFGSMPTFEAPAGLEVATPEQAEAAAANPVLAYGGEGSENPILLTFYALGLAGQMTGDPKYARSGANTLLALVRQMDPDADFKTHL
ncbi:MAG: helix-turn-helix transcriptional regulator, partial [Tepidiforma sp.]